MDMEVSIRAPLAQSTSTSKSNPKVVLDTQRMQGIQPKLRAPRNPYLESRGQPNNQAIGSGSTWLWGLEFYTPPPML